MKWLVDAAGILGFCYIEPTKQALPCYPAMNSQPWTPTHSTYTKVVRNIDWLSNDDKIFQAEIITNDR